MASTAGDPSQAERLEAVVEAGPGATDKALAGDPLSEKPAHESSSDASEAALEQNEVEKAKTMPEAPQRSAGKIALIMGSLCVSLIRMRNEERARC